MSMTGLDTFDRTLQKTNEWLNDIMDEAGWSDRHMAYQALRAVLHALRDHLVMDELAHLGAELPLLIRGIYYEGWDPSAMRLKERHKEQFLSHIAEAFQRMEPTVDAEEVLRCVLHVLAKRVSQGEIHDVRNMLPEEIRELWPEPVA